MDTSELTEWEKERERDDFARLLEQSRKLDEIKRASMSKFVSTSVLDENNQETEKKKQQALPTQEALAAATGAIVDVDTLFAAERARDRDVTREMFIAAREKKYGPATTRVEYEWRPHAILCRRFNVPNPYPEYAFQIFLLLISRLLFYLWILN